MSSYQTPPDAGQDAYTIDDYWVALYRRKWLILLVTICAAAVAGYTTTLMDPQYEATAAFYVPYDIAGPSEGPEAGKARLPTGIQEHAKAYVTLLKANDAKRKIAAAFPGKTPRQLNSAVDFVVTRESVIRIFARDKEPKVAADLANAFITYFNDFHTNVIRENIQGSLKNLDAKLVEVRKVRTAAQEERRAFMEKHGLAGVGAKIEQLEAQRIRFDENHRLAQVDLAAIDKRLATLEERLKQEAQAYESGAIILQNAVIFNLQERLAQLEVQLAGLEAEFRPEHPQAVSLRDQRDRAKKALDDEIRRIVASDSKLVGSLYGDLRAELANRLIERAWIGSRVEGFQSAVLALDKRVQELPVLLAELEVIDENIRRQQTFVDRLSDAREALLGREMRERPTIMVIENALPPDKPVFPIMALNVGVAALGGLIAGVLYAMFLDHLQTRRNRVMLRRLQVNDWARAMNEELAASNGGRN